MENPGETLVGDYLRYIRGCDFVDYNVYTKHVQGEIDVIGIKNEEKEVFICEVVTHLTTGLQYVKNARPDSGDRLLRKFRKASEYGRVAFKGYRTHYMLWSPIVKDSGGKEEYNQYSHLNRLRNGIEAELGERIEFMINEDYSSAIVALREYARSESKELKSPIMRFLQIEEWCRRTSARPDGEWTTHRTAFKQPSEQAVASIGDSTPV